MKEQELVELLTRCGVRRVSVRNGNIRGCCPFHGENNPSWAITVRSPHFYNCFSCGAKGTLFNFLVEIAKMSYEQAIRLVDAPTTKRHSGLVSLSDEPERLVVKADEVMDDVKMWRFFEGENTLGWAYLREQRGIKKAVLRAARVAYDPDENRVVMPWYIKGKFVGATGRALSENSYARVLPYFSLKKGGSLYSPWGRKGSLTTLVKQTAVIVEGEIDAMKVAGALDAEKYHVVAVGFGGFSDTQRQVLWESFPSRDVLLFFDNDEAGRKITKHVRGKLRGLRVREVLWEGVKEKDPAELKYGAIREMVEVKYVVSKFIDFCK